MTKEEFERTVTAKILEEFMFVEDYEEFNIVWKNIFKRYNLEQDPLSGALFAPEDYREFPTEIKNGFIELFYY